MPLRNKENLKIKYRLSIFYQQIGDLLTNLFTGHLIGHFKFGKYCVYMSFGAIKKPCKHNIYRVLGTFKDALSGLDGTRTRDPMRDRHVF
jgi:hypothetical protein